MAAQGVFTRMAPYRWALEPTLALVIAVVWGSVALVFGARSSLLIIVLLAGAVAVSRVLPTAALVLTAVGTVSAVAVASSLAGSPFGDVAALTLVFVSGCLASWGTCLSGRPPLRFLSLAAALLVGALVTCMLMVSLFVPSRDGLGGMPQFLVELALRISGGFLATTVLVAGWVGSLLLRRRAEERRVAQAMAQDTAGGELTAETWLMLRPPSGWLSGPDLNARRPGFRSVSRRTVLIDGGIAGAFVLFGFLSDPYSSVLSIVVLAGFTAAVAVRRLSPALALTLAWITALSQMLLGQPVLGSNIAILAVLYATAAYAERVVRWAGLGSVGVGALLAASYLSLSQRGVTTLATAMEQEDVGSLVWSLVATFIVCLAVLGLSWTLGLLMRTWHSARTGRLSQQRAVEEQRAAQRNVIVEQERNRIARDMHDVVAHSLAVVIAQADGARYARAQNPEAVDEALTTISTTARDALGDVRILLTRLRQDDAAGPQPVLADLDRLGRVS